MTIKKLIKKEKGLFRPCNWREICEKAVKQQSLDESFFDRIDQYAHTADAFSKFNTLEEKKIVVAEWLAQLSVENEFLAKEDPEYLQYRDNKNVGNRSFSKLGRVVDFHVFSSIKARYQETGEPLKFDAIKDIWVKFAEQFKVLHIFHSMTFNSVFIDGQVSREQKRDSLFGTYLEYKKDNLPNGVPIKRESSSSNNISSGTSDHVQSTCVAQRPQNNVQERRISKELDALGAISQALVNTVLMSTSLVTPEVSGGEESGTASGKSSSHVAKKARRSSAEADKTPAPPSSDSSSTSSSSSSSTTVISEQKPPPKKVAALSRAAQIRVKKLQVGSSEVLPPQSNGESSSNSFAAASLLSGGGSSAVSLMMPLFQTNG